MSPLRRHHQMTRPRTCQVSFKAILDFPSRICKPPPPVAKSRSCGVVPCLQIRLDDVLDRKHLPPLSLKDFEEWLLYVETSAENLYFLLWLKEYTIRYKHWAAHVRRGSLIKEDEAWTGYASAHLTTFYSRAKDHFLMPNAGYQLQVPSHYLAPFHELGMLDGQPDPANFTQLAIETHKLLEQSLRRFVPAQLGNVGNSRALWALLGSSMLLLFGAVPPLVVNMTLGRSRWLRLIAFPALWLGLTGFLCGLYGICLDVYILGDFRQLRKYELARPEISSTELQPLQTTGTLSQLRIPPMPTVPPPVPVIDESTHPLPRLPSIACASSDPTQDFHPPRTQSALDPIPLETVAQFPRTSPMDRPSASTVNECDESTLYNTSASFIHPFEGKYDFDSVDLSCLPEESQRISAFDFETLPPRLRSEHLPGHKSSSTKIIASTSNSHTPSSSFGTPFPVIPFQRRPNNCEKTMRSRLRRIKAVPAFAVPWTCVLSPVIRRGQWEIVTRSACCAFLISCAIVAIMLAVPVQ